MSDMTTLRFVAEVPKEHFSKDVVFQVLDQLKDLINDGEVSLEDFIADIAEEDLELIDIVFEPYEDKTGVDISFEDTDGSKVDIGEWVPSLNGYRLRIPVPISRVVR